MTYDDVTGNGEGMVRVGMGSAAAMSTGGSGR